MMGLATEHTCMTHRQWCGDGPREGGAGAGWRWAKVGGSGDIGNSVNNKIKLKTESLLTFHMEDNIKH